MTPTKLNMLSAVCGCLLSVPVAAAEPAISESAVSTAIEFMPDIVYGTGDGVDLHMDIARPKDLNEPAPCVVFIHGGGWRMGNKSMHTKQIKAFAEQGFVAASVQYRFVPRYQFPAQVHDVKCAVRYLRAHAEKYGIDPDRVGAIGFSAGAHLAMMLGTMDNGDGLEGDGGWSDQPSQVQAVVAYFGPTDFRTGEVPARTAPLLTAFLGGTREEKPEAWTSASPAHYIDSDDPPMLLFQGTKDHLVPYTQAIQMAEAMTKAGVLGRVELLMNRGHGWGGPERLRTDAETLEFFDNFLRQQ